MSHDQILLSWLFDSEQESVKIVPPVLCKLSHDSEDEFLVPPKEPKKKSDVFLSL